MNTSFSPPRQSWIDVLRGTSVLMVILLHAHGFAFNAYGATADTTNLLVKCVDLLNLAAAPFRMELMFLLSGLFVATGLKKGRSQYLTGKISNVLHPFLLWSVVIFALRQVGSVIAKGEAIDWSPLMQIPTGSSALTWFLYYLFVFYLLTPLLRRANPVVVGAACMLLSVAIPEDFFNYHELAYYFFYFYLGDYLARRKVALTGQASPAVLLGSTAALVVTGFLGITSDLSKTWAGYLPLVLASLPVIFHVAAMASRHRFSQPLAYVGRNSIVFYLIHFPIYVGLGYVLHKLTDNGMLVFAVLLGVGVGVPVVLSVARTRNLLGPLDLMFSLKYVLDARSRKLATEPQPA